jgi:hypothetical protein
MLNCMHTRYVEFDDAVYENLALFCSVSAVFAILLFYVLTFMILSLFVI